MSRSKQLSSSFTSQGTAAKGVSEEVLFNVLKKMGDATPPPVWPSVVQVILSKMYSSPSDPVLMRIWNTLVPAISTSSDAIAATFLGVTKIMERQGEVSESLLEAAMEASDEGLDDLRMSRILPFTALKVNSNVAVDDAVLFTPWMLTVTLSCFFTLKMSTQRRYL